MYRVVVLAIMVAICQGFSLDRWLAVNRMTVENEGGKIWVLLIAGSAGFSDYRHQADICHAYHIVRGHGIPQENIVTMMEDDIAYNEENPHKGVIINAIGGPNVYEGVVKDYTRVDVTPQNFIDILRGDSESMQGIGSGKVISSGPKDYVFVNFAGLGESGGIAFPNLDILYATDLFRELKNMHTAKSYKQMLIYIEASYAGSMFENILPGNMNITAHTASNAQEGSYACTIDEALGVYLGDCWSLNWMNDTDSHKDLSKETIEEQYKRVKAETTTSHASIYGDVNVIYHEPLSTFMGSKILGETRRGKIILDDAIISQDVMVETLKRKLIKSVDPEKISELKKKIQYHELMEFAVQELMTAITLFVVQHDEDLANEVIFEDDHPILDFECNALVINVFHDKCFKISKHPYVTKYTYILSNLCSVSSPKVIVEAINTYC